MRKTKPVTKCGGINDAPGTPKKIYQLWYRMFDRCYDKKQLSRMRGQAYKDCSVCPEWHYLSNFARDIKELPNYNKWLASDDYAFDKDINVPGNKEYNKRACSFVSKKESSQDVLKRHPDIQKMAVAASRVPYTLKKGNEILSFESETAACKHFGVCHGTMSAYRYRGATYKGYSVARA